MPLAAYLLDRFQGRLRVVRKRTSPIPRSTRGCGDKVRFRKFVSGLVSPCAPSGVSWRTAQHAFVWAEASGRANDNRRAGALAEVQRGHYFEELEPDVLLAFCGLGVLALLNNE
jgi:hypothetical protein